MKRGTSALVLAENLSPCRPADGSMIKFSSRDRTEMGIYPIEDEHRYYSRHVISALRKSLKLKMGRGLGRGLVLM